MSFSPSRPPAGASPSTTPTTPTTRPFVPPACLARGYLHVQEPMGATPTLPLASTPPRSTPPAFPTTPPRSEGTTTTTSPSTPPNTGLGSSSDVPLLVTFQGRETDVVRTSTQRVLRRFSSGLKLRQYSRRYFELSGHSLFWYESEEDARVKGMGGAVGYVSLLAVEEVRLIGPSLKGDARSAPPPGTYGGLELVDAAKGEDARGDLILYAETQTQMDEWTRTLTKTHEMYVRHPLAELGGPTQAAQVKSLIQGELFIRDTLDGMPISSWSNGLVCLFDSRIECHAPGKRSSKSGAPTMRRSYWLTREFHVADSRVRANAFVLSDGMLTVYFYAKDARTKLFWMESIAKVLVKLGTMIEHVRRVSRALSLASPAKPGAAEPRRAAESDEEEDDDDEDDDEEAEEMRRKMKLPPQLRDESIRKFYSPNAASTTAHETIGAPLVLSEEEEEKQLRKARKSYVARMNDDSPLVATPVEQRTRGTKSNGSPLFKFAAASAKPPAPKAETALTSKLL